MPLLRAHSALAGAAALIRRLRASAARAEARFVSGLAFGLYAYVIFTPGHRQRWRAPKFSRQVSLTQLLVFDAPHVEPFPRLAPPVQWSFEFASSARQSVSQTTWRQIAEVWPVSRHYQIPLPGHRPTSLSYVPAAFSIRPEAWTSDIRGCQGKAWHILPRFASTHAGVNPSPARAECEYAAFGAQTTV